MKETYKITIMTNIYKEVTKKELKVERLIEKMKLDNKQLLLLNQVLDIERELTLMENY